MECKKCGAIVKEGQKFCENCGEIVIDNVTDSSENKMESVVNNQNSQAEQKNNIDINNTIEGSKATSDWIDNNQNDSKNQKKNKGFSKILILVIIILLLIGGIFYFLNKNENEQQNDKNNNSKLEDNNNNKNDNNDDVNNKNDNISSSDLELLKTAKLSDSFQKQKEEREKSFSNYSHETYYEGSVGLKLNPIIFKIENGNLVLYQLEKAQPMTKQNYNCEEVECIKQNIDLNNEKVKYISASLITSGNYNNNIMVLTENQNIYEGIIVGEDCNSLECKYDINLKKVDTNYKFKEIVQVLGVNYGLTTNNKLVRTADLTPIDNIPLIINTYASQTPLGYYLGNEQINNPLQLSIYENGTLGIGNYDQNISNTKEIYNILRNDGTKIVAKQVFTTNSCDTFILGIDNFLYKTNLDSCKTIITSDIKVNKYTEKQVNSIDYGVSIDQSSDNVMQMTMKQMRVVIEPLNIRIQYNDGTFDLLQIDRNYIGGAYYIIFEN